MFLQVSVCSWGRGSLYDVTSCLVDWSHDWSHVSSERVSVSGLMFLRGGVYVQGILSRGFLSRLSLPEGCLSEGVLSGKPPVRSTSGWYASYWNTFLFEECFVLRFYSMNAVNNFKNSVEQHSVIAGRNWQSLKINLHRLSQYFVSSTISIPAHSTTNWQAILFFIHLTWH